MWTLKIANVGYKKSQNPEKPHAIWFNVEFDVLESTNPEYAPGSTVSETLDISQKRNLDDVARFAAAAANCSPEQIDPDLMVQLCGEDQPLAGVQVKCEAWDEPNKKSPGSFTKKKWSTC